MPLARALRLHPSDNVAVCTTAVHAGDTVDVMAADGGHTTAAAVSDITFCNKIALTDIPKGADVIKYGEVIGTASEDIARGSLANDRNIASQPRAYADEYLLGKKE